MSALPNSKRITATSRRECRRARAATSASGDERGENGDPSSPKTKIAPLSGALAPRRPPTRPPIRIREIARFALRLLRSGAEDRAATAVQQMDGAVVLKLGQPVKGGQAGEHPRAASEQPFQAAPILNIFVPHTEHLPSVAGRPFFIVL